MKKSIFIWILLVLGGIVFISCDTPTKNEDETTDNTVKLQGRVLNQETNAPIDSAIVRLLNYSPETYIYTDGEGKFLLEIEADHTFEIRTVAYKDSYVSDSTLVLIVPGRNVNVPVLKLTPTNSTPVTSSSAASIVLAEISASSIGVRESGSVETAEIIFEVQDSAGVPVDLQHATDVHFRLGSAPGGGEFMHPLQAKTNNVGQVKLNLFSGTISGVVQIIAEIFNGGTTIRSKPVAVAIHGGLPDSSHFSLAVDQLNFPGYNIYGLTDMISAFVGDKYGNPVRTGTAVYFTTDGGLIEGSALTNDQGRAAVNLISADPKPEHPVLGKGFATITGRTADENQNTIESRTVVLFSGVPQITVQPEAVFVPNGGSQGFTYMVQDQNGNPLAGGTSVNVKVEQGEVEAIGDVEVSIPDTQSKTWTTFSFTLVDAFPDSLRPNNVRVKVSCTGPNGDAKQTILGNAE